MKAKAGIPDTKNEAGKVVKNESEIGISGNINTSSSFSAMFPLKLAAMNLGNAAGMLVRIVGCWDSKFSHVVKTYKSVYLVISGGGLVSLAVIIADVSQLERISFTMTVACLCLVSVGRRLWVMKK
jgi:hypothetical protein